MVKRTGAIRMSDELKKKTAETAALYFDGVTGEVPFKLWGEFDRELAKEFSLFITGKMYSREVIDHPSRQFVTVAALTALGKTEELRLHLHAGLNVGIEPRHLAEAIFQTGVYAGVPAMNEGLKTLRSLLKELGRWPIE